MHYWNLHCQNVTGLTFLKHYYTSYKLSTVLISLFWTTWTQFDIKTGTPNPVCIAYITIYRCTNGNLDNVYKFAIIQPTRCVSPSLLWFWMMLLRSRWIAWIVIVNGSLSVVANAPNCKYLEKKIHIIIIKTYKY